MREGQITIVNRLGLHARAAAKFVNLAKTFSSQVELTRDAERVDGKSIMQMMVLAATQGTQLEIVADGADAEDALAALGGLVERGFDEDDEGNPIEPQTSPA